MHVLCDKAVPKPARIEPLITIHRQKVLESMQLGRQLQAGALLAASRMVALSKSWVDWANVHDLVDALAEPGVRVRLVVDIEDGRAGLAPVDLVGREAVWRLSGIAAAPTRHVEEELQPVLHFACH